MVPHEIELEDDDNMKGNEYHWVCRECGVTYPNDNSFKGQCPECGVITLANGDYGEEDKKKEDIVNKPNHYQNVIGDHEAIDVIECVIDRYHDKLGHSDAYCLGNVLKYIIRGADKRDDPTEDLLKAQWYLGRLLGDGS